MANNEEISQEVKVEETRPVSAENEIVAKEEKVVETEVKETKVKEAKNDNKAKADKNNKKPKKAKDKKPSKMAKSLKETSSELKKVTWPKFTTVLKQTGVVLAVTAAFLLVVFGIDRLCSWLVGFIV